MAAQTSTGRSLARFQTAGSFRMFGHFLDSHAGLLESMTVSGAFELFLRADLYAALDDPSPSPAVRLNHAVAVAMSGGPRLACSCWKGRPLSARSLCSTRWRRRAPTCSGGSTVRRTRPMPIARC